MILDRYGYPMGPDPSVLPEVNLSITLTAISAKPRKLVSKIVIGAFDDLQWAAPSLEPPSAIDKLAAIPFHIHRDVATRIAGLPDDLVPAAIKDIALGAILELIPKQLWPSAHDCQIEWDKSVLGRVIAPNNRRNPSE